jgi:hypothetical protein
LIDTGDVLARIDARGVVAWHADNLGTIASVTQLAQPSARAISPSRGHALFCNCVSAT